MTRTARIAAAAAAALLLLVGFTTLSAGTAGANTIAMTYACSSASFGTQPWNPSVTITATPDPVSPGGAVAMTVSYSAGPQGGPPGSSPAEVALALTGATAGSATATGTATQGPGFGNFSLTSFTGSAQAAGPGTLTATVGVMTLTSYYGSTITCTPSGAAAAASVSVMVPTSGPSSTIISTSSIITTSTTAPISTTTTASTSTTSPNVTSTTSPNVTTTTALGSTTTASTTPIPTIVVNPTTPTAGETTTTVADGSATTAPADTVDEDCDAPILDSVSPASGPAGTEVTVTGSCFVIGATTVLLGDVEVPAAVTRERAFGDTLRFVVPEGTDLGAVDVLVRTANGDSDIVPAGVFTVTDGTADVPDGSTSDVLQPIVTPVSSSSGGSGLARTGASAGLLALLGLMMLGAGALAFRASKRISQN